MISAVIGEELGLVGLALLVAAYCALAYAGLRLAISCKDAFGKRLAAGVTALLCGQAAINLAAVLGLVPLTGIPLPFVSYGGSSLVIALLSVGILLNIARGHGRATTAAVPDRRRGNDGARRPVARGSGGAARARRGSDVRRVASRRSSFLSAATPSTPSASRASRGSRARASRGRSASPPPRPRRACGSSGGAGPTSCSAVAATSPARWCLRPG